MRIGSHEVGVMGLGTAHFAFREDLDADRSIATIRSAVDSGVRLIDTALAYSRRDVPGYAEAIVGRALAGASAAGDVLVATKGGHYRSGEDFPVDGRPEALRSHCEASLTALGIERIGLYQLHWVDPAVPVSESVGALADLRREGKIEMIGLSNVDRTQLAEAQAVTAIASVQNRLSLDHPEDLPMAKLCAAADIAYLAYMPLGGSATARAGSSAACIEVAERHGASWQQVALAWLLLQPNIIPIVGSSRAETLVDSLRAAGLGLLDEDLALLPPA
jgi:aryl-alcohol dehydrogenase-like predicted oxidoreductase